MPDTDVGGDASASQSSQNPNPGVAKPTVKRDPFIVDREAMMVRIDERVEQSRAADDETFFQQGDPRAIALAAEMGRESRGERIAADRGQGRQEAAAVEVEPETQEVDSATAVEATAIDPLEDFIVRQPGKAPMFKTVVNGRVVLMPLEAARTQLQKHAAADARHQNLNAREQQLKARERALKAAPLVAVPVVDDATLDTEAQGLVRSLLSDPEDVAAKKMAATLKRLRAQPQVDVNAVGRQAASIARQEIAAEDTSRALATGLSKFQQAYPEMTEGSELYLIADRKTTAIAEANPDWGPEQVMLEAGEQTRAWVKSMGGKVPAPTVVRLSPERQQVKNNLKPMPQARTARPAAAQDANADQSPQDVMAEIRKSRSQAY